MCDTVFTCQLPFQRLLEITFLEVYKWDVMILKFSCRLINVFLETSNYI